jgi:hypothetical protein
MYKKIFATTAVLIMAGSILAVSSNEGNIVSPASPSERVKGSGPVEVGTGAIMTVDAYWRTSGNSETTAGIHFLGTTDDEPLEIKVNNQRVMRFEPNSSNLPNIIGGDPANSVTSGSSGVVIGGGKNHSVDGDWAVIGGGYDNEILHDLATISGGTGNSASGEKSTIGGGRFNEVTAYGATIAGGHMNSVSGSNGTIGGGLSNEVSQNYATIGGGYHNQAEGYYSAVPGGYYNQASGYSSFAAGYRAKANHNGSFVWGDFSASDLTTTGINEFIVRASGGVWFGTNSSPSTPAGRFINTSTGAYLSTGGTWTNASDKNLKEGFEPVNDAEILEKVAELPITSWNYKSEDQSTKHIGPVAQDFHAAFGLGQDDKSISTVDANGVALAAIQALYQQNQEKEAKIADLENQVESQRGQLQAQQEYLKTLEARLGALEAASK